MSLSRQRKFHISGAMAAVTVMALLYVSAFSQSAASQGQECTNTTHSFFTDLSDESTVEFPDGGGSNTSLKMLLPRWADVVEASAHLKGSPNITSSENPLDIALVNDVSGSMDDNCHCADGTPSTNGFCNASQGYPYSPDYPCKIEDMKNASKIFAGDVLSVPDNMLGLVSYSTKLKSFIDLTDNLTVLEDEIDTYAAAGSTCISCGIKKAIEIVSAGTNDEQVIVLMSDGIANQCFSGVACGEAAAKAQALSEAQRAWDNYSISIITVGFGEDADAELMETIANISKDGGGRGQFFMANETNIEDLYEDIAGILTAVYPTNPYMNVGSQGGNEWSWPGPFNTQDDAADYSTEMESILSTCTCPGCVISGSDCIVPFELGSDTAGFITLNTTVVTQSCVECETDSDCDYLDDQCNDGVCTDNTCVQQAKADTTPCDDGDACTTDDACTSGQCVSGGPLDCDDSNFCTEDLCDSQTGCYHLDDNEGVVCDQGSSMCASECDIGYDQYTCQSGSCAFNQVVVTSDCSPDSCSSGSCNGCSSLCGATCEDNEDCPDTDCPTDTCIGNDYVDYPDDIANDCLGDCSCEDNVCGPPTIYPNDPRCVECVTDDDCSDGNFCNGAEVCNQVTFTCEDGPDPDCDDGVACTHDSCNEGTDSCDHIPDDGLCDDGLYCDGSETCNPASGCQPGSVVDCSGFDLPEISVCDNNPDSNPFTWDHAAGFESECNEASDSCTTGNYSFTHQCRDNDDFDGFDIEHCGAECDQHSDCICPDDGCVGDDYYDYPDEGACQSDCTCSGCEPEISVDDPQCMQVCERNGEFGEGNEYLCHGDGTYDRCREDGTGYEYENICMEECTASPQCDGFPPTYHFMACDWYGESYLQDYCDDQCQIRDNNCEDSWNGCTSDPECDEAVPGTNSCTYQCEYKPEICYIDDQWGEKPHEYVCLEDNTYLECIDLGSGYGTEYEHVNECSYLCSGDLACDGLPPGSELESCDVFGQDYLQDYCDPSCHIQDDNCESSFQDCTSDPECDEAVPGTTEWEQCYTCTYQFCGDSFINPFEPFNEQCDPDMHNSLQCIQNPETCEEGGHRLGIRDSLGDCGGCLCEEDAYEYDCVVGECGAACDEDSDCGNFCTGDELSYSGQCDLARDCDCSWDTKDCNDYDDDYFVNFHCDAQTGDIWNWYQDWVCSEDGVADCAYSGSDWKLDIHEDCVDDCSDTDGGIDFDLQGTATDRELCDDQSQTSCPQQSYTDYCSAEGEVLTEYYCEGDDVASTTLDCDSLDHYDDYEYYCDSDDVRRHRLFHDFSCSVDGCTESVDWVDDELVETCDQDGWYNFGNEEGLNDPECENRDYTCVADGEAECSYTVTESHDYDSQDGSYCAEAGESVENRDYYCDATGSAQYESTPPQDCGPEAWSGGGNVEGFGDDPACEYTDYFCVDDGVSDYCTSGTPYSGDFDSQDVTECDGPGLIGDHDYWCDPGTCDSGTPSNGCSSGDTWYDLRCDQSCGAQCDENSDCPENSCSDTYDDFCVGMKLNEYDSDKVLDSTTVDDECDNTCDISIESCSCSDCSVNCSPPSINQYCVEGVCGAECDDSGDCPPWLDYTEEICNYDIACGNDCGCGPGSEEYCPPPGTVEEGTCYYGLRDCVDVDGCTLDTCVLDTGQYCDPLEGCSDVPCNDIPPITLFHDGSSEKVREFASGGGSDSSAKARVPQALVVSTATVNLTGGPVSFTEDRILDFALVNDVSGSMDDNCYCADGTPSNGGLCSTEQGYPYHPDYPCKIEDMKNASNVFADAVLGIDGNMLGLVSYSSKLKSFIDLTDDDVVIGNEIDSYDAGGFTCISCGIRKGIDIITAGDNEPVIILMTDGEANRCFAGVACGEAAAKAQALSEAQRAWDDYGISIITVGFGEDADEALLGSIANVSGDEGGLGQYYFAPETDLEFLYEDLATLLTKVSPTDPSLDVGSDAIPDWSYPGEFMISETANFTTGLQGLLDCTCPGCTPDGDDCIVDLEMISTTAGIMTANNLDIRGCIPEIPVIEFPDCYQNSDCGGGPDAMEEGAWSDWDCAYDDICDESGDCTRSRNVTSYTCNSPGTEQAFCSSSMSPEVDHDTQPRDTEGTPCDDGLFCTDPDACTGGVCAGPDRDCDDQNESTTDSCDDDQDTCVNEHHNSSGSDRDGDTIDDGDDDCPDTWGDYCRGCPEPACTGCAIPECPTSGPPECTADDSQCSPFLCPADGCGLDTCEEYEWADFPDSVASVCELEGDAGACSTPTCEGTATCTLDEQCGWVPPCETAGHVLISEVLYDPAIREPGSEWVELYNPTGSDADISGWKLTDGEDTFTFPAESVISAGGYLTVTNDMGDYYAAHSCYADLEGMGLQLANSADSVTLLDGNDTEVDGVSWGGDPSWDISAGEGLSLVRDPAYCDTDTAEDWLGDQAPTPVCSLFPEPELCLIITGLGVLDADFNPVSEVAPGEMYHIEVDIENTCDHDVRPVQIIQVKEDGQIAFGTLEYTIGPLATATSTLGFMLPEEAVPGTNVSADVFNWNSWPPSVPFEAYSENGFVQFDVSSGGA